MKHTTIAFVTLALALASGCITRKQQVNISASYAWEHRYTNADTVVVNGENIKVPEGGSFWILSNITLKNLIKQTANSAYMKSLADGTVITNFPSMNNF